MLTATVPDKRALDDLMAIGLLPDGVRVGIWDVGDPDATPEGVEPGEIELVVMPHYSQGPGTYLRLRTLPGLRVVQLPSAGFEHALPHLPSGVAVCNGAGVHDAETAELGVGLLLASLRGIDEAARDMADGLWQPRYRSSLADRRVMVVGYGNIGTALAARLRPFEVDVVPVARSRREVDGVLVHAMTELPELLPTVDAVVLIVPLTAETSSLAGVDFLSRMRDGAVLVNVGRGKVVDTDALVAEVSSGRLRAALDVTDPEPLPSDHPLWHLPGVLITPHVGGMTSATFPRMAALTRRQLAELAAGGEPVNVVATT